MASVIQKAYAYVVEGGLSVVCFPGCVPVECLKVDGSSQGAVFLWADDHNYGGIR